MTKDESRAVAFLGVLLCLALVARYINRPKPVTINAAAVDIEALREAGRSLADKQQPRSKARRKSANVETDKVQDVKQPWTKPAWQRAQAAPEVSSPVSTESSTIAPTDKRNRPLNINTATRSEIEALPWIGPAMAQRIIARRDSVRRFEKLEDLDVVRGIGPALLRKLQPLIAF